MDEVLMAILLGALSLVGFVNVLLAAQVAEDAGRLKNARPVLPAWLWFLAVVVTSLFGVVAYWLMNYSTLSRRQDD